MPSLQAFYKEKTGIGLFLKIYSLSIVLKYSKGKSLGKIHVTKGSRVFLFDCMICILLCLPYFILILIYFALNLFHRTNLFNYSSERCFLLMIFFAYFTPFNYSYLRNHTRTRTIIALGRDHVQFQQWKKCAEFLLVFKLIVSSEQKKY